MHCAISCDNPQRYVTFMGEDKQKEPVGVVHFRISQAATWYQWYLAHCSCHRLIPGQPGTLHIDIWPAWHITAWNLAFVLQAAPWAVSYCLPPGSTHMWHDTSVSPRNWWTYRHKDDDDQCWWCWKHEDGQYSGLLFRPCQNQSIADIETV